MCSRTGVYGFPLKVSIPITDSLNKSIEDLNYPLEVQWAPKATPPTFINTGQVANLGFTDFGINTSSSLRLKGNSFSHMSTQICQSLHRGFLPSSDAQYCFGEIVLTFKSNSNFGEQYVFVCVPLLARTTAKPSLFLQSLEKQALPSRPLTFLDYLPQRGLDYITYVSCCDQVKEKKTVPTNIRVILFVKGIECPFDVLAKIASMISKPNKEPAFPPVFLPDGIIAQKDMDPYIIATEQDYKSKLLYATYIPTPTKEVSGRRTDDIASYKCVPLDPERNIKDNQIVVDTTNGEILTDVVKERQEAVDTAEPLLTPARIEKIFFILLAVLLTLLLLTIVGIGVIYIITDDAEETVAELLGNIQSWPSTLIYVIVSIIIGLLMGIYIKSL